jgi:hypothetical protein
MIYDLAAYKIQRSKVKKRCTQYKDRSDYRVIADLVDETSTPILCMCYFVAEIRGMTPDIRAKIDMISKWYNDTVIDSENKDFTP